MGGGKEGENCYGQKGKEKILNLVNYDENEGDEPSVEIP